MFFNNQLSADGLIMMPLALYCRERNNRLSCTGMTGYLGVINSVCQKQKAWHLALYCIHISKPAIMITGYMCVRNWKRLDNGIFFNRLQTQ